MSIIERACKKAPPIRSRNFWYIRSGTRRSELTLYSPTVSNTQNAFGEIRDRYSLSHCCDADDDRSVSPSGALQEKLGSSAQRVEL